MAKAFGVTEGVLMEAVCLVATSITELRKLFVKNERELVSKS
jgi:hypothetical protein